VGLVLAVSGDTGVVGAGIAVPADGIAGAGQEHGIAQGPEVLHAGAPPPQVRCAEGAGAAVVVGGERGGGGTGALLQLEDLVVADAAGGGDSLARGPEDDAAGGHMCEG